jgi:hypothetical protein
MNIPKLVQIPDAAVISRQSAYFSRLHDLAPGNKERILKLV